MSMSSGTPRREKGKLSLAKARRFRKAQANARSRANAQSPNTSTAKVPSHPSSSLGTVNPAAPPAQRNNGATASVPPIHFINRRVAKVFGDGKIYLGTITEYTSAVESEDSEAFSIANTKLSEYKTPPSDQHTYVFFVPRPSCLVFSTNTAKSLSHRVPGYSASTTTTFQAARGGNLTLIEKGLFLHFVAVGL